MEDPKFRIINIPTPVGLVRYKKLDLPKGMLDLHPLPVSEGSGYQEAYNLGDPDDVYGDASRREAEDDFDDEEDEVLARGGINQYAGEAEEEDEVDYYGRLGKGKGFQKGNKDKGKSEGGHAVAGKGYGNGFDEGFSGTKGMKGNLGFFNGKGKSKGYVVEDRFPSKGKGKGKGDEYDFKGKGRSKGKGYHNDEWGFTQSYGYEAQKGKGKSFGFVLAHPVMSEESGPGRVVSGPSASSGSKHKPLISEASRAIWVKDHYEEHIPYVPSCIIGKLVGKKGANKQIIERKFGVQIRFPSPESQDETVSVLGPEERSVEGAGSELRELIHKHISPLGWTHFLCFPLSKNEALRKKVEEFFDMIPEKFKTVAMPPRRLHLTLSMLRLHSKNAVDDVKKVLKDTQMTGNIRIRFQGLHIMNDNPAEARVVFTAGSSSPLASSRLNTIGESVLRPLVRLGLVSPLDLHSQKALSPGGGEVDMKMHVTLLNAKYMKTRAAGGQGEGLGVEEGKMDVRELLGDEYVSGFDFGEVDIDELRLVSYTGGFEESGPNKGFYKILGSKKIE